MRAFIPTLILLTACTTGPTLRPQTTKESLPALTPATTAPPTVMWNASPDFTTLRDAYARRADFSKRCESNRPGKEFMQRIEAKDFSGAAGVTTTFLAACPVDAQAHLWTAGALQELGKHDEADVHMKWFIGLTDSAMSVGNGLTPETAYTTISIAEEYAILVRLRKESVKQSLIKGATLLDAIEVKDESGATSTVYFNPHWHFIRLAHMFSEAQ